MLLKRVSTSLTITETVQIMCQLMSLQCICTNFSFQLESSNFFAVSVLNPGIKLNWHEKYEPTKVQEVKQMVL